MAWYTGNQELDLSRNTNQEIETLLKGSLEDERAKISLCKYLKHNIGVTTELIAGIKTFPYQEIILRTWFKKNYNLMVAGRGGAKSWLAALFACLYSIFNPQTRVIIVAQNFRTARRIFEQAEKFITSKNAVLLRQCFSKDPSRRNDSWTWDVNEGVITALPLASGDRIRGTRADVLIVDEFALIPEEIYKGILMPFLVAKSNINEQLKIKEIEDKLIKEGRLLEEQRSVFGGNKKVLALSSASYQFEFLFRLYQDWLNKIASPVADTKASYSVFQLSYEALPLELMDATIIEEAKSGGASNAVFQREYCAMFTDDSDSYFSARKMAECTISNGEDPTIEIKGKSGDEYIVSVDPSFSSSKASDDFAMNVIRINRNTKTGTLVHNYAVAGGDLKDHIKYFYYLLTFFNVVYVIIDKGGGEQFISACNESSIFKEANLKINFFNACFDDEVNYAQGVRESKRDYNLTNKKIVHIQQFTPQTIRRMNEYLQASIDHKRIWFASCASAHPGEYPRLMEIEVPVVEKGANYKSKLIEFIDEQSDLINLTKKECSLIEVKTSQSTGVQGFDLPSHLRRSTSKDRARKDSYTCLMLGNWAMKVLFDMQDEKETSTPSFTPFFVQ